MMTRLSHRHRGIATRAVAPAERAAIERGRWLLVLDTAVDEGASGLYERLGFELSGVIPEYALRPHGGLTGTMIYWKRLQRYGSVKSAQSTLHRALDDLAPRRDRQEIGRFQAGAADQGAVDVGDRHQFGGIRGLDRAAIENADLAALALKSVGRDPRINR